MKNAFPSADAQTALSAEALQMRLGLSYNIPPGSPQPLGVECSVHEVLDRRDVFPGGILVPQTFGGMANWNPHVHALVTDT